MSNSISPSNSLSENFAIAYADQKIDNAEREMIRSCLLIASRTRKQEFRSIDKLADEGDRDMRTVARKYADFTLGKTSCSVNAGLEKPRCQAFQTEYMRAFAKQSLAADLMRIHNAWYNGEG